MKRIYITVFVLAFVLCMTLAGCGALSAPAAPSIPDSYTVEELLDMAYSLAYPENGSADFDGALPYFTAAAERGSGEAADWLGYAYEQGTLGEVNLELARQWYEKAVELGNHYAMNSLGCLLESSEDAESNMERISELFRQSAELGCEYAYANAARMYADGIGVKQDFNTAVEYFEKALAFEPDNIWAIGDYAWLYLNGTGVERDLDKAAQMAEVAMAGSNPWSSYLVVELTSNGYACSNDLVKQAAAYMAELGDIDCIHYLGDMYTFDECVEQDKEKALAAFETTIFSKDLPVSHDDLDYASARCFDLLLSGDLTDEDLTRAILIQCVLDGAEVVNGEASPEAFATAAKALAWQFYFGENNHMADPAVSCRLFELGAATGDEEAVRIAALLNIHGNGCKADFNKAVTLVSEYLQISEADAYNEIGCYYFNGLNTETNLEEGFRLMKIAADKGSTTAMNNVAQMYFYGEGTAKNSATALKYAQMAAEAGSESDFLNFLLGVAYYKGNGVEKDLHRAVEYLSQCVDSDPFSVNLILGDIYYFGPEDIADREKAIEHFEAGLLAKYTAAKYTDDMDVLHTMNFRYGEKDCIIYDPNKQMTLLNLFLDNYRSLAESGDINAMYQLSQAVLNSTGSYDAEALKWLTKGAELDDPRFLSALGTAYGFGLGLSKNITKAAEYYQKAYDMGARDGETLNNLAYLYVYDFHKVEEGIALYEELGDGLSYSTIGSIYFEGNGVPKDLDKALEYYLKAFREGPVYAHRVADTYYAMGDYTNAAKYYEQYLNEFGASDSKASQYEQRLQECYSKLK